MLIKNSGVARILFRGGGALGLRFRGGHNIVEKQKQKKVLTSLRNKLTSNNKKEEKKKGHHSSQMCEGARNNHFIQTLKNNEISMI